ncbi:uncharacterized protein FA14DRAFT_128078 [Meira miltonrushii]|uniref:Uncharacterized protein n=1 Tax=Meira miltonrushii TaxID=1280837 RepID=A0A316V2H5_9BASI|nr:uncharacterized protein FA14DRAFT_128078 [Meira miltonrushii]PWN31464.1 hypothetical protein FA14DRAFT_128078 [Meira miltonrushii]
MSGANFAPYQPPPDERQKALLAESNTSRSSAPSVPHQEGGRSSTQQSQTANGEASRIYDPTTAATRASIDTDFDPRYATESYQSSSPYTPANANQARPAWATASSGVGGGPASIESQYRNQPAWSQNGQIGGGAGLGPSNASRPDHLSYSTSQGWNLSNLCFATWGLPPFTSVLLLIWETENDLVRFHAYQAGLFGVANVLLLWILHSWFGWYTFSIIVGMASLGYSWVCGSNAANAAPTLARSPFLPVLGPLAEQWVGEE